MAPADIEVASLAAAKHVIASGIFQQSQHIGFYKAHKGELDPAALLHEALAQGKTCYLPTLDPMTDNQLIFVNYDHGETLVKNRFDIPEPMMKPTNVIGAKMMDLVITPLVAFDTNGNRLGMGKGFYDRTFAFKINDSTKPILMGFGYAFQESTGLKPKSWDVPLDYVTTEQGI
ncbi:MAG: 5-formyltetrahydrofolate cyclo-ligase, partial [Coxiellaceae bacterium]|nr:5-formyltetrahydrofolate cyclo-ligase [Coxiellaceae bacterium]